MKALVPKILYEALTCVCWLLCLCPALALTWWVSERWMPLDFSALNARTVVSLPLLYVVFMVALVVVTGLLVRLVPRPAIGVHDFPRSRAAMLWALRFIFQRLLALPMWSRILLAQSPSRFLFLWALGARAHPDISCASDAMILDFYYMEFARKIQIGTQALLANHYIFGNKLWIDRVVLEEDVEVAGFTKILPGVRLRQGARLALGAVLYPEVVVGEHASIGAGVVCMPRVEIGRGCHIGHYSLIERGVAIPDGTTIPPLSLIRTADDIPRSP